MRGLSPFARLLIFSGFAVEQEPAPTPSERRGSINADARKRVDVDDRGAEIAVADGDRAADAERSASRARLRVIEMRAEWIDASAADSGLKMQELDHEAASVIAQGAFGPVQNTQISKPDKAAALNDIQFFILHGWAMALAAAGKATPKSMREEFARQHLLAHWAAHLVAEDKPLHSMQMAAGAALLAHGWTTPRDLAFHKKSAVGHENALKTLLRRGRADAALWLIGEGFDPRAVDFALEDSPLGPTGEPQEPLLRMLDAVEVALVANQPKTAEAMRAPVAAWRENDELQKIVDASRETRHTDTERASKRL